MNNKLKKNKNIKVTTLFDYYRGESSLLISKSFIIFELGTRTNKLGESSFTLIKDLRIVITF